MNAVRKSFGIWLLTTTICLAASADVQLPALGIYISGPAGGDVLDTIIPELARLSFAEAGSRDISTEHFPIATFDHANGDEIQVIAGKRCAVLGFMAAKQPPGTDGNER